MKDGKIKSSLLTLWDKIYCAKELHYVRKHYRLSIMTAEETIKYIRDHECSIARFGDGEFSLMLQYGAPGFQKCSAAMSQGLLNVFENVPENLLICVPYYIVSTKGLKPEGKLFWETWAREHQKETVEAIRKKTGEEYRFGDAGLSRPFSPYRTSSFADKMFPMLKELWRDKDILIVEGAQTRLGVGNDLLANARSIKRILGPAENAYELYEKILSTVTSLYNGEMVILALGPTATILAADLTKKGIQALDLGHIDIQYEWYLSGEKKLTPILGKYTNEAAGGRNVADSHDKVYLSQIIATVN